MHLCSSYRHSCCTVGLPACLCTRNNGNPLRGTLLQWCGPLSWMLCHWHGWKWTLIPEVKLGVECYSNLNHCINGQGIFTNHCVGAVISIGNNYNYGKAQWYYDIVLEYNISIGTSTVCMCRYIEWGKYIVFFGGEGGACGSINGRQNTGNSRTQCVGPPRDSDTYMQFRNDTPSSRWRTRITAN